EMGRLLGEPAKAMHGRGEEQQPRDETPPDNRGAEHDPKGVHEGEKLARSRLRTIGRKYEPRSARRRLRPRGRGPSRATAADPREWLARHLTPPRHGQTSSITSPQIIAPRRPTCIHSLNSDYGLTDSTTR